MNQETECNYTVSVPALPRCVTFGETPEQAIEMAKEAIGLYIEELKERGEEIPDNSNTLEYTLNIESA